MEIKAIEKDRLKYLKIEQQLDLPREVDKYDKLEKQGQKLSIRTLVNVVIRS